MGKWSRPGGKLRELGAYALTERDLLAILISTGIRGKSAVQIADEILDQYGSLTAMANVPLERFLGFKGLSDVKIIRIAAAFEIARRLPMGASSEQEEE
jgi:DNA repair protein RadC